MFELLEVDHEKVGEACDCVANQISPPTHRESVLIVEISRPHASKQFVS